MCTFCCCWEWQCGLISLSHSSPIIVRVVLISAIFRFSVTHHFAHFGCCKLVFVGVHLGIRPRRLGRRGGGGASDALRYLAMHNPRSGSEPPTLPHDGRRGASASAHTICIRWWCSRFCKGESMYQQRHKGGVVARRALQAMVRVCCGLRSHVEEGVGVAAADGDGRNHLLLLHSDVGWLLGHPTRVFR